MLKVEVLPMSTTIGLPTHENLKIPYLQKLSWFLWPQCSAMYV